MPTIGSLAIKITTDIRDATMGFLSLEKQAKSSTGVIDKLSSGFSIGKIGETAMGGIMPWVAGLGSIGGVVGTFGKMSAEMKEVINLSNQMGVSIEETQRLGRVATGTGSSMEAVAGGMSKMQKAIGDAVTKGGEMAQAFGDIGVNARELMGLGTEQQFRRIAQAIESVQNPTLRTAALLKIFSESGTQLRGVLKAVAEGKDLEKSAVSGTSATAITEYAKGWKSLGSSLWTGAEDFAGFYLNLAGWGKTTAQIAVEEQTRATAAMNTARELAKQEAHLRSIAANEKLAADAAARRATVTSSVQSFQTEIESKLREMAIPESDLPIFHLEEQRRTLEDQMSKAFWKGGMTNTQMDEIRQEIEHVNALIAKMKEATKAKKDMAEVERGSQLWEENQTPLEKFKGRMIELDQLLQKRAVMRETAKRAGQSALQDFLRAQPQTPAFSYAGGGHPGSAEFRDAVLRATNGPGVRTETKEALDKAAKALDMLTEIRNLLFDKAGNLVVAEPAGLGN
jgi:hypothetical protein